MQDSEDERCELNFYVLLINDPGKKNSTHIVYIVNKFVCRILMRMSDVN